MLTVQYGNRNTISRGLSNFNINYTHFAWLKSVITIAKPLLQTPLFVREINAAENFELLVSNDIEAAANVPRYLYRLFAYLCRSERFVNFVTRTGCIRGYVYLTVWYLLFNSSDGTFGSRIREFSTRCLFTYKFLRVLL